MTVFQTEGRRIRQDSQSGFKSGGLRSSEGRNEHSSRRGPARSPCLPARGLVRSRLRIRSRLGKLACGSWAAPQADVGTADNRCSISGELLRMDRCIAPSDTHCPSTARSSRQRPLPGGGSWTMDAPRTSLFEQFSAPDRTTVEFFPSWIRGRFRGGSNIRMATASKAWVISEAATWRCPALVHLPFLAGRESE